MRKWKLEEIKNDKSIKFISVDQAADIMDFSYITLIRAIKNKQDIGFIYTVKGNKCKISKESFIEYAKSGMTIDKVKMMSSDFITVLQAASVIGCTPQILREKMKLGEDIGFKYMQYGGKWKIFRKSFIDFFERGGESVDDKC